MSSRRADLDAIRIVSAALVVAIHVTAAAVRERAAASELITFSRALLDVAVPSFMAVAGVLAWGRGPGAGGWPAFLGRRFAGTGLPYLAWSGVFLVTGHLMSGRAYPDSVESWGDTLFLGGAWYHLYFVPLVFMAYALAPLVRPLLKRHPTAFWLVVTLACAAGRPLLPGQIAGSVLLAKDVSLLVRYTPFVTLGAWFWLREHKAAPWLRRWWPALLVGGGSMWGAQVTGAMRLPLPAAASFGYYLAISAALLGVFGLGAWIAQVAGRSARRLAALADLTFGIYLAHPLALVLWLRLAGTFAPGRPLTAAWFVALTYAVVLGASWALARALHAWKATRWMV
ncbi:MAG: hypothetical protein C0418_04890 [Coriobacteriaceae bacterium]|nr:hypothetical protein [Coriobacteriaceae bacterium]